MMSCEYQNKSRKIELIFCKNNMQLTVVYINRFDNCGTPKNDTYVTNRNLVLIWQINDKNIR